MESLKLSPKAGYAEATLTLIITNMSDAKTIGVAFEPDPYHKLNLTNSRGEDFQVINLSGIGTAFTRYDGSLSGSMTDIPPRSSILISVKTQVLWTGKAGDYRPYRLQTVIFFGAEDKGTYPDINKYNLVMDIK